MKVKSLLLVFALCAVPALALAQETSAPSTPSQTGGGLSTGAAGSPLDVMGIKKYLLGPGDQLDLRVFNEPQFNSQLVVNDEGNVEVPFIDQPIPARCRTDREIRADIVKALSKFLNKPQVSLRVSDMRSLPPAVVYGAVRVPARVQMHKRARLRELLATAGGITEGAGGDIQIFHPEPMMCPEPGDEVRNPLIAHHPTDPTQVSYEVFSLNDLKMGKEGADPFIRPGDIVIVQEAKPVYITGMVQAPQGIYLRDTTRMLSQAIAQVGGLRKEAKLSEITIYRREEGSPDAKKMVVNFKNIREGKEKDIALHPYDIIEVPDNTGGVKNTLKNILMGTVSGGMTAFGQTALPRVLY